MLPCGAGLSSGNGNTAAVEACASFGCFNPGFSFTDLPFGPASIAAYSDSPDVYLFATQRATGENSNGSYVSIDTLPSKPACCLSTSYVGLRCTQCLSYPTHTSCCSIAHKCDFMFDVRELSINRPYPALRLKVVETFFLRQVFYLDNTGTQQSIATSLPNAQSVLVLPANSSTPNEAFRLLVGGNTVYDENYVGGSAAMQLYSVNGSCTPLSAFRLHEFVQEVAIAAFLKL